MPIFSEEVQKNIEAYFTTLETNVFLKKDIGRILANCRSQWHLPQGFKLDDFLRHLLHASKLKEIILASPNYGKKVTRFAWINPSPYQLGLSLRSGSYLSHHTAVYLHGLARIAPRTIYVNSEQSSKSRGKNLLEQERIDLAFESRPRTSKYIFTCGNHEVCCINGLNTNNLGVETIKTSGRGELRVTNIERTLIDITVRPFYSGGVREVQKFYIKAKGRTSVDKLVSLLRKINYVYPYHQAIGFYMERAGFERSALTLLKKMGLKYDFYLDYRIDEKNYSKDWRIYFPKGLADPTKDSSH